MGPLAGSTSRTQISRSDSRKAGRCARSWTETHGGIQGGARRATQLTSHMPPRPAMPPLVGRRYDVAVGHPSASPGHFVCHSAKKCMGGYLLRRRALHMRTCIGRLPATETCASHAHVHREPSSRHAQKVSEFNGCRAGNRTWQFAQKTFEIVLLQGGPRSPNAWHPDSLGSGRVADSQY